MLPYHWIFYFLAWRLAIFLAAAAPVKSSKLGAARRLECSTRFFGVAEEAGFSSSIAWAIESRRAVTSESRSMGAAADVGAGGW
jgi:hypothetical protein